MLIALVVVVVVVVVVVILCLLKFIVIRIILYAWADITHDIPYATSKSDTSLL